jgi:CHAD domain-containing protein
MPFRFKKKESVAKAVRRLCGERLDEALEALERGAKFRAVHGVRKEIKKLRAILRLTRGEIREETYRKHTKVLREAANLLTAFRDAQVKLGAFEDTVKHFRRQLPAQPFPEIKSALRDYCRAEERKLGGCLKRLKGILTESKEELDHLEVKSRGWKAIGPGLKRIYGRGREAFETAGRKPSETNFHEWRKRVKDLWHQLCLLSPARPHELGVRTHDLETLGNLLGDDHDLFLLKQFIASQFNGSQNAKTFKKLIVVRQEELRSEALKLGAQFYPKKPNHFCRQIGDYWKTWRRG